jgi:nucleoside-diphosphate-sugar epimerase
MKILITGNLGYVGPVVSNYLEKKIKKAKIFGYDNGYFYKNILNKNKLKNVQQTIGDIRKIKSNYIKKFDTIIHLAAISNDPIGNNFKKVTNDINYKASVRLFKLAKDN